MTVPYRTPRSTIECLLARASGVPMIAKSHGSEWSACGLTPLGAAAYPGSSVRTLRRAPLRVPSNPLHTT